MNKKSILLLSGLGGFIGGYLPKLFGVDSLSGSSLLGAFVGGIVGIIIGYRYVDL